MVGAGGVAAAAGVARRHGAVCGGGGAAGGDPADLLIRPSESPRDAPSAHLAARNLTARPRRDPPESVRRRMPESPVSPPGAGNLPSRRSSLAAFRRVGAALLRPPPPVARSALHAPTGRAFLPSVTTGPGTGIHRQSSASGAGSATEAGAALRVGACKQPEQRSRFGESRRASGPGRRQCVAARGLPIAGRAPPQSRHGRTSRGERPEGLARVLYFCNDQIFLRFLAPFLSAVIGCIDHER